MSKQKHFFLRRSFFSLFWTQFFGALNDNFFKNALVILITYVIAVKQGIDPSALVTMAAGIFILPFFLFSANAGIIADNMEKSKLMRIVKLAEIVIMCLASFAFFMESVNLLLFALFLMGIQSTFFGPLKYSLLPIILEPEELVRGNGLINSATFIAILLGTIGGSYLILVENGVMLTSGIIILLAIIGWLTSFSIPKIEATHEQKMKLAHALNFVSVTWHLCKNSTKKKILHKTIIGVSWFWYIGASILSQLPTFVSINLQANNTVYIFFLGLFAIGIGTGAMVCSRYIPKPTIKYASASLLAMTGFFVIYYMSYFIYEAEPLVGGGKVGFVHLLSQLSIYPMIISFFMIAVTGGIFIIPQFSLTQQESDPDERSQVIAANNVFNSLFMVGSAVFILILNIIQLPIPLILLIIGLSNLLFLIWWRSCKVDEKYTK